MRRTSLTRRRVRALLEAVALVLASGAKVDRELEKARDWLAEEDQRRLPRRQHADGCRCAVHSRAGAGER